jgi:orotate phosphoribosyltransferase
MQLILNIDNVGETLLTVVREGCKSNSDMKNNRLELLKILTKNSLEVSQYPKFPLVSGTLSNFYVDCKMTTLLSHGLNLVGQIIFDVIAPLNIKGIGGLTLGADPIANATAMIAGQKGLDLISFVIRKETKKHGKMKWIEGGIRSGDRVVIIDDVITTGGSTIKAIDKADEVGLNIVKVIVLVDREEGGRQNIQDRGYEVESIYTKSELMKEYAKYNK